VVNVQAEPVGGTAAAVGLAQRATARLTEPRVKGALLLFSGRPTAMTCL
jgi:hypothetical protein